MSNDTQAVDTCPRHPKETAADSAFGEGHMRNGRFLLKSPAGNRYICEACANEILLTAAAGLETLTPVWDEHALAVILKAREESERKAAA